MGRKWMPLAAAFAIIFAMVGLVVASVPLYRMFCRVTGLGGTPQIAAAAPGAVPGRLIRVRFDTSVARGMNWRFAPEQREIDVHPGEQTMAIFAATNLSAVEEVGTATFNVTPDKAGPYFDKIQCFCFSEQRLAPGQTIELPVVFFVDPAIESNPHTAEIGTITLSYTFFRKGTS